MLHPLRHAIAVTPVRVLRERGWSLMLVALAAATFEPPFKTGTRRSLPSYKHVAKCERVCKHVR